MRGPIELQDYCAQDLRIFCARSDMRSDLIGSDLDLRSDLDESRS